MKLKNLVTVCVSAIACLSCTSDAQPARWHNIKPRTKPMIVGVQTHFGAKVESASYDVQRTADAIRELGFSSWRDNISMPRWVSIQRGKRDQQEVAQRFRAFAAKVPNAPANMLNVSDWPTGGTQAQRITSYAPAISAAIADYPPARLIEVMNEYDKGGDGSDGSVAGYAAVIAQAIPAVRRAHPSISVIVGAAADDKGGLDFAWTRALLRQSVLRQADGLSVHIYNHCSVPRRAHAATDMMMRLDGLHSDMAALGLGNMPLYVSEFGWPTGAGRCQIPADEAAANIFKFTLLSAARDFITGVWYYELKDSGTTSGDPESSFGLYDFQYRPKPGACAAKAANNIVNSGAIAATFEGQAVTAVLLQSGAVTRTVVWATDRNRPVLISIPRPVTVTPLCGVATRVPGGNYSIGFRPVIIPGDLLSGTAGGTSTLR